MRVSDEWIAMKIDALTKNERSDDYTPWRVTLDAVWDLRDQREQIAALTAEVERLQQECSLPFPNEADRAIDSEDLRCMVEANARFLGISLEKYLQKLPLPALPQLEEERDIPYDSDPDLRDLGKVVSE